MSYVKKGDRVFSPVVQKRRGAYFKCETCGCEFYVFPSIIRKAEKRGHSIRYCSMGCYDKTGDNNPFWGKNHSKKSIKKMGEHPDRSRFKNGKDNPNFIRFGEEYGFTGKTKGWCQRKLLKEIGKCEKCGFNDKRALCIHHKNKKRGDNNRANLELLCWNCHVIEHFKDKSGMYKFLKGSEYRRRENAQKEKGANPE